MTEAKTFNLRDMWGNLKPKIPYLLGLLVISIGIGRLALYNSELIAEAKKQEINAEILVETLEAEKLAQLNFGLEALTASLKMGKKLKKLDKDVKPYNRMRGVAQLWHVDFKVKERNRFERHKDRIYDLTFSPDGKTIATANSGNTAKLWSVKGELLYTLKSTNNEMDNVNSIAFSPNGDTIGTANSDGTIKLWNTQGRLTQTFKKQKDAFSSIVFSPDGKTIATTSQDNTAQLWDTQGQLRQTLKGHNGKITKIIFSPDGKTIATASEDKTVKLWNTQGEVTQTLKIEQECRSIAFSPDSKTIATGGFSGKLQLWNTQGKVLDTLRSYGGTVQSIAFSPNGEMMVTTTGSSIAFWNTKNRYNNNIFYEDKLIQTLKASRGGDYNSVAFSPDGKTIATAGRYDLIRLWSTNTDRLPYLNIGSTSNVSSPDGKIIAGIEDGYKNIKLWNSQGKLLQTLEGHTGIVNSVAFSSKNIIASASNDKTVRLWNTQGKLLKTLQGYKDTVKSVAFSPDGQTVATASSGIVKLWNTQGKLLKTFGEKFGNISRVTFSPDGKTIATANGDSLQFPPRSNLQLWNTRGRLLQTFEKNTDTINDITFSPDSKTIVTASGVIAQLWNTQGKLLQTFRGHTGGVSSVAFNPDGNIIATASGDQTVMLWNTQGQTVRSLEGFETGVNSVAFSPDGNTIATGTKFVVKLWNFDLDKLLVSICTSIDDYLKHNPNISEQDKNLCNDVL